MPAHLKTQNHEAVTSAGSIAYSLFRSSKRRTLAIAIGRDRQVRVLAPYCMHEQRITDFIHEKSQWIIKKIKELEHRFPAALKHYYIDGEEFLFLGRSYPLRHIPSERKRITVEMSDRFEAFVPLDMPWKNIEQGIRKGLCSWYRKQAERIVRERLPLWVEKLGMGPQKVSIRTQKRIWGSCYCRTKSININWKIVMAPIEVIDYIILHELCHLYAPNHSKRFWDKVRGIFPSYKDCEKWLKNNEGLMSLS
ncbi:MAG: SprT family zinc-dependent metalloprotease [Candidatus Omnitrophica bacterium]|nr:SprT family zinc-dependent metalloprotease [Candidatus Omnitrophota bacterium]